MGCACSRRRHSAHIRRLMTPPPCVIDRSAFLGSRSPPSSRQPARTRRVECAKSSERESRRLARFTSAASLSPGSDCGRCGAHRCGRYLGSVFFFFCLKKKERTVFVVQCETTGGFLVFFVRLATASRTNPCAKPLPDPLWWPGAEEARLFCDGDRPRYRYECTPVFTYRQRRLPSSR